MASLLIPTRSDLDFFEQTITLDGSSFDFEFRWNTRDEVWYLSIFDPLTVAASDGSRSAILAGIPIRVRWPLLGLYRYRTRPLGELIAFDTTGEDADPGRRDLGTRVQLIYFEQADLAAQGVGLPL